MTTSTTEDHQPLFAEIIIAPLATLYTYYITDTQKEFVKIGSKVVVPLGTRTVQGFVVKIKNKTEVVLGKIKPIISVISSTPCFLSNQLDFFQWIAGYYCETLSNVVDTAVPPFAKSKWIKLVEAEQCSEEIKKLKGKQQQLVYDFILSSGSRLQADEITKKFQGSAVIIKRLAELKLIKISYKENISVNNPAHVSWAKKTIELNDYQQKAFSYIKDLIDKKTFSTVALHGVTGSGKTEVYIEAALHATALGKSVLVIVPEIALTPQLIDRFRARCGPSVILLHSGLNKKIRWDGWVSAMQSSAQITIGARSAVFAPLKNLGLIVVDEEHDASFKQNDGFRYHGRDLAIMRGKFEDCTVVLGSATLSLETINNAYLKKYSYISLPSKHAVNQKLKVDIVDLNKIKPWQMKSKNISPTLFTCIQDALNRKEQIFILYNRRGFSTYLQCNKCNEVINCPRCSISLSFHKGLGSLICHLCNYSCSIPSICPSCKKDKVNSSEAEDPKNSIFSFRGAGTEKVYDELKELFPESRIDRLDRDSVSSEADYRRILDKVRNQETDILVGTQMIAKGHDLENVTLVGIVDCDVGIHFPDFRGSERAFYLLTQSAGRAGRDQKEGRVIMQTRMPNHPSIVKAAEQDFRGFAQQELANRKSLGYPPFSRLLRIIATCSSDNTTGLRLLYALKDRLLEKESQLCEEITILGPTTAPIQKIKNQWRHHILIKANSAAKLNKTLSFLKQQVSKSKKIKLTFDLDPYDML